MSSERAADRTVRRFVGGGAERGLKSVSPQEAGVITLSEPMLNPLWAYLLVPEKETPPITTWIGGGLILGALAWRYWPRKRVAKSAGVV